MTRSTDPETRFKGGDLGTVTTDTLPQPIADAVKGVKAGQVVGPVTVDAGWAVLKIDERGPEVAPSLDQVRPQIIAFIRDDQVKSLILRLRKSAKIDLLVAPPPSVPGGPTEPASAPTLRGPLPSGGAASNATPSTAVNSVPPDTE
jgi:peptidyl-prolyl cis-trans isomerase C